MDFSDDSKFDSSKYIPDFMRSEEEEISEEEFTKKYNILREHSDKLFEEKSRILKERGLPWLATAYCNALVNQYLVIKTLYDRFPESRDNMQLVMLSHQSVGGLLMSGLVVLMVTEEIQKKKAEEVELLNSIAKGTAGRVKE